MRAAHKKVSVRHGHGDLAAFIDRYAAVLEAVARYVHRQTTYVHGSTTPKPKGSWVSCTDAAEWIASDLPSLYKRSFGTGGAPPLKVWRVRSMLSIASYLGAWEALDVRCVRGKGLAPVVAPRRLRLVK